MTDPKHCKGCNHIRHGKPDSKQAVWCCAQGRPLPEAVGHCKLTGLHSMIHVRDRIAMADADDRFRGAV